MNALNLVLFQKPCGLVMCGRARADGRPFCPEHQLDFEASPEGQHPRPCAGTDFRDRVWKERCKLDEETKRAQLERDTREKAKP